MNDTDFRLHHDASSINSGKAFIRDLLVPTIVIFDSHFVAKEQPVRGFAVEAHLHKPDPIVLKHVVNPNKFLPARPGETYNYSALTPDHIAQARTDTLQIQEDMISRREEAMMIEQIPEQACSIGRDIRGWVECWCQAMQTRSGLRPDTLIADPCAFNRLLEANGIDPEAYKNELADDPLDRREKVPEAIKHGKDLFPLVESVYSYQSWYSNEVGEIVGMMPENSIILVNVRGVFAYRLYGAVEHDGAPYRTHRLPMIGTDPETSVEFAMTKSAPMMHLRLPQAAVMLRLGPQS